MTSVPPAQVNQRLVPLNAFIGLVSGPGTSWPNQLQKVGYSLTALELPLDARGQRVVADAVAFNANTSNFLVVETKSGKSIKPQQAARYNQVNPHRIVQDVGVSIESDQNLTVSPLYVCLEAHEPSIVQGLRQAGCDYPVLSVAQKSIALVPSGTHPGPVEAVLTGPINTKGWPSAAIHVDDQSTTDEFDRIAAQALVSAGGSTAAPEISVPTLAEQAMRFLPLYGTQYRTRLIKMFEQALRRFCDNSSGKYEFRNPTGTRRDSAVRIIQDPSTADPRGRAQSYQALRRPYRGRRTSQVDPSQLALFDTDRMPLIEQLDELQADGGPEADSDTTRDEP